MVHIWHEDSENSAQTQFWRFLSSYIPELASADIKGFNGNMYLADYLQSANLIQGDKYYIIMDFVIDNNSALRYYKVCKQFINSHKQFNILLTDIVCFEHMLLDFSLFTSWIAPVNPTVTYSYLLNIRSELLSVIDNGDNWLDNKCITGYLLKLKGANENTPDNKKSDILCSNTLETLCVSLLGALTNRKPCKFAVNKVNLGECWVCSCCNKDVKNCRLANKKKTSGIKAQNIWNKSKARSIINKL